MSEKVLEFFRTKEPKFNDVDDESLTKFIREKYPEFRSELGGPQLLSEVGRPIVFDQGKKPFFKREQLKRSGNIVPLYGTKKGRQAQEELFREPITDPVKEFDIRQERQDELLKFYEAGLLDTDKLANDDRDLIMEGFRLREQGARAATDDPAKHRLALEQYQAVGQELGVGVIGPEGGTSTVLGPIGKPVRRGMQVFGAATADAFTLLSNAMHDGPDIPANNIAAFSANPDADELPIDRVIAELGDDYKWTRRGGQLGMVLAEILPFLGLMELAPAAASRGIIPGGAATAASASPHIAAATFGFDDDGNVNPVGLLAAYGIPVIDKFGRTMSAKALKNQLQKTHVATLNVNGEAVTSTILKRYPMLEKEAVQKAIELSAGQGAVMSFLTAIHSPAVMSADDPGAAWEEMLINNVAMALTARFGVGRSYTRAEMYNAVRRGEMPFIRSEYTLKIPTPKNKAIETAKPQKRPEDTLEPVLIEGPSAAPAEVAVPKPTLKAYENTPNKGDYRNEQIAFLSGGHSNQLMQTAANRGDIGLMATPSKKHLVTGGQAANYPFVAIDNGKFSQKKQEWSPEKFESLVDDTIKNVGADKILFAVAPDHVDIVDGKPVGNAEKTLKLYEQWQPKLKEKGVPVAFVAQDGLESRLSEIPWDKIDVMFIGGSDAFKLGQFENAEQKANWESIWEQAHIRNIPIHVGRVNTNERLTGFSAGIGASTADGTMLFRGPQKTQQENLESWLDQYNKERLPYDARNFAELGRAPTSQELYELALDPDLGVEYVEDLGAFRPALGQINEIRKQNGLKPLKKRPSLTAKETYVNEGIVLGEPTKITAAKDKQLDAEYGWVPIDRVEASHTGSEFTANERYAPLKNTRDYAVDQVEKDKVLLASKNWNPGDYITWGESAATGPIMVSRGNDGVYRVLGGNGRLQAMKLLSDSQWSAFSEQMEGHANKFNLGARPSDRHVLARVLSETNVASKEGIAAANEIIDLLNPSPGVVANQADMAKVDAKAIPYETVEQLSPSSTAREIRDWVTARIEANQIDRNTRAQLLSSDAQAHAYAMRLLAHKAYENDTVVDYYRNESKPITIREGVIEKAIPLALNLRAKGGGAMADSITEMVKAVAEYQDKFPSYRLSEVLDMIYRQGEMAESIEAKLGRSFAAAISHQLVYDKGGKRVSAARTMDNLTDFWASMTNSIKQFQPGEIDMFTEGGQRSVLDPVKDFLRMRIGEDFVVEEPGSGSYSGRPDIRVKRIKDLRKKEREKGLTRQEHEEMDSLEAALGQNFMDFYNSQESKESREASIAKQEKDQQRQELEALRKKRLVGGDVKSQEDLFGEPGQMSLFDQGILNLEQAAKLSRELSDVDAKLQEVGGTQSEIDRYESPDAFQQSEKLSAQESGLRQRRAEILNQLERVSEPFGLTGEALQGRRGKDLEQFFRTLSEYDSVRDFIDSELMSLKSEGTSALHEVDGRSLSGTQAHLEKMRENFKTPVASEAASTRPYPMAESLVDGARAIADVARLPKSDNRIRVLKNRIAEGIKKPQGFQIIGQRIRSSDEAAAVFQMLRDPKVETLWYVATLKGQIVGIKGVSSRLPNTTDAFTADFNGIEYLQDMIMSGKADGFYLVHNHPSGSVKPSKADRETTVYFNKPEFGLSRFYDGHIIIDHGKYTVIDAEGGSTERRLDDVAARPDPLVQGDPGEAIFSTLDVAQRIAAETTNIKPGETHMGVMFIDNAHQVRAVAEMDLSLITNQLDFDGLVGDIREVARDVGALAAFGYVNGGKMPPGMRDVVTELIGNDVLLDVSWDAGQQTGLSVRGALSYPPVPGGNWFGMDTNAARQTIQVREDSAKEAEPEGITVRLEHRKGKAPEEIKEQLGGLEYVKAIKYPEIFQLIKELTGLPPLVRKMRGGTRGLFYGRGSGEIHMSREVFKDPIQAARTIMHEFGHLNDYLPEHTMKRGNLFGRLASLRNFLKTTFPMSKKAGATLEAADRQKLQNQARRDAGKRPAKDDQAGLEAYNKQVREIYANLVEKEIQARGLVKEDEVRSELWELSKLWRPFSPNAPQWYLDYRKGSDELYADMVSVLFNAPGLLQERAPIAYKMFWEYLDRKPVVKNELLELQRFLSTGIDKVIDKRRSDIKEMFEEGDAALMRNWEEGEARTKSFQGWWLRSKQAIYDANEAILQQTRKLEGNAFDRGKEVRDYLERMAMSDNENSRMLRRIHRNVISVLDEWQMPSALLGEWLLNKRIAFDRDDVANPLGHTPSTAQENLSKLRREYGAMKAGALDFAAERFRQISLDIAREAVRVGSYSREKFETTIVPNNHYAAFAVSEYVQRLGYVPAGLKAVVGTHKGVMNPFLATTLKLMSLNNLNNLQRAKNSVISFLSTVYPSEISQARTVYVEGRGHQPVAPPDGKGHIMVLRDGKPLWFEVDEQVSRIFKQEKQTDLEVFLSGALDYPFRQVFYPLWISKNPGFHFVNMIRDFRRTARNLQIGMPTLAGDYMKVLMPSIFRALGKGHPLIDEMVANYAFGPVESSFIATAGYGPTVDRNNLDRQMLERYKMLPVELTADRGMIAKGWKVAKGVGDMLEFVGQVFESMPKMAGYKRLRVRGDRPNAAAAEVREYAGTPNIYRTGRDIKTVRSAIPFMNMFLRGYAADFKKATDPKTRADWAFRWARTDGLFAMLRAFAVAGLLGEGLRRIFEGTSEYQRRNYHIIPIGEIDDKEAYGGKKSVVLQIPMDETSRLLSAWAYSLTDALIKGMKGDDQANVMKTITEVLGVGAGEMPGGNPIMTIGKAWAEYVSGANPYDSHYGRPVVPAREFRVGGWDSHQHMITWTYNQSGLQNLFRQDPNARRDIEIIMNNIPVANRFLRFTDRGRAEQQMKDEVAEQIVRDKLFLSMPQNAQRLRTEMYRLRSLGADDRDRRQAERYNNLNIWHGSIYKPYEETIDLWEDRGNKGEANRVRAQLEKQTREYIRQQNLE